MKVAKRITLLFVSVFSLTAGPITALAWTDTLTSDTTSIRKVHIDELRDGTSAGVDGLSEAIDGINDIRAEYGFTPFDSWTDSTVTADSTSIRKAHIDEMRDKIDDVEQYYASCINAGNPTAWSDTTITADSTSVRGAHITELRNAVDSASTCAACAPTCQKCSGASGLVNQLSSEDLWNDCASGTCVTGNCSGTGATCGYTPTGQQSTGCTTTCNACNGSGTCNTASASGNDCATTCYQCDTSGGCTVVAADYAQGSNCRAAASNCTEAQYCQTICGSTTCNTPYTAAGTDPRNYCTASSCSTGYCDGVGGCQYTANGVDCSDNECKTCNGSGTCANNKANGTTCPSNECKTCNGSGSCANNKANGTACGGGGICGSTCTNGVCGDFAPAGTPCDGSGWGCKACDGFGNCENANDCGYCGFNKICYCGFCSNSQCEIC